MSLSRLDRLKTEPRGLMAGHVSIYTNLWHRKCFEPVKRRHGSLRPEWVSHRFEIKGGISLRETMLRDLSGPNHLLSGAWALDASKGEISYRGIPVRILEGVL